MASNQKSSNTKQRSQHCIFCGCKIRGKQFVRISKYEHADSECLNLQKRLAFDEAMISAREEQIVGPCLS
jgi:hypothetical protein